MERVLPILFNTDMVRAILDGRKTVTRRLIKPQQLIGILPDKCKNGMPEEFLKEKKFMFKPYCDMTDAELIETAYNPPYQPGDILYVRETWCENPNYKEYYFKTRPYGIPPYGLKWHPSIHMPKEAARIWLKVKDVRVEQLQEITSEQIEREGVETEYPHVLNGVEKRYAFSQLWNSTIKKSDLERYGWNANPWVWVIEFERCEKPENF